MTDAPIVPAPVGISALTSGPATPDEAKAAIESRIQDKEFYAKIKAQDPIARQEWDRLHKIAYLPMAASGVEPVSEQMRREAAQREQGLMTLANIGGLTPEQTTQIANRTPVPRVEHEFAERELDRMKNDTAFLRRFAAGDRAAVNEKFRMAALKALPVIPGT
jgi:hypothetical protein